MAITKLTQHDNCEVYAQRENWSDGHYASLHCACHSVWIQWLSKSDTDELKNLGVEVKPYKPTSFVQFCD